MLEYNWYGQVSQSDTPMQINDFKEECCENEVNCVDDKNSVMIFIE